MLRDPTEFRKRFAKWKQGGKPYLYGIPYDDDNHNLDYDQARATQLGYDADETGHYPTRDYETGRYLKSPAHLTVSKSIYADMGLGYDIMYNEKDKSLYSQPNWGSTYKERLPKYKDGKDAYRYIQDGNGGWNRITNDSTADLFANLVVTPSGKRLVETRPKNLYGNESLNSEYNVKLRSLSPPRSIHQEPGLEIVSPEFDLLSVGTGGLKEISRLRSYGGVLKVLNRPKDQLTYLYLDWKGSPVGKIDVTTYDNMPTVSFIRSNKKGSQRYLYDAVIKDVTERGMPGLYSGKNLLSAPKTYSTWKHYPDKQLVGNYGTHTNFNMAKGPMQSYSHDKLKMLKNWRDDIFDGTKEGPVYLLSKPSQPVIEWSPYTPDISNVMTIFGNPTLNHIYRE